MSFEDALFLLTLALIIWHLVLSRRRTEALESEVDGHRLAWGRQFARHETRLDALEKQAGIGCEARLVAKERR